MIKIVWEEGANSKGSKIPVDVFYTLEDVEYDSKNIPDEEPISESRR